MMRLWLLLPSRLRRLLVVIGVFITALVASYFGGRKAAKTAAKIDDLQNEVKAHDRLNKADTGDGDSDDVLRRKLHDLAKRNGG